MESFCATRMEGRGTENRGRKALHAALKERAERIRSKEGGHEAGESRFVEQGQDVQLGRPGRSLRSVRLRARGLRLGKRKQEALSPG